MWKIWGVFCCLKFYFKHSLITKYFYFTVIKRLYNIKKDKRHLSLARVLGKKNVITPDLNDWVKFANVCNPHFKWMKTNQKWKILALKLFRLTSEHVHGSSGREVNSSRRGARRCFNITWAHLPPLSCSTVVTKTQLTVLSHKARAADTLLTPLWRWKQSEVKKTKQKSDMRYYIQSI